ncbi:WYL domain-containing protein [Saccharibacillus sp. CPCC 101409]|uniref:helix-turn-helix transcriptional regulator n=1 Tax=Saccharibacillus sp. CPCC 101409 TaxID=3058041 RepID=UPI002671FB0A|nr:WYL domain-containing protein [Saccharibacillus sp. CPCC 101409]MDO3410028.1 WYL domain-containing protein [Saccharibacillus sp. CPCC 101409]
MNKTDRMLAILLRLQRGGPRRAEDLARTFETSVRTIYRDMQALSESGVPILGTPGTGYSLMEGYFLPPVMLTADEALAALIGTDFTARYFGGRVQTGSRAFREKLELILPANVLEEVERLRAATKLVSEKKPPESEDELEAAECLREAVLERRKVEFVYVKAGEESSASGSALEADRRTAAPYGLALLRGVWMLIARCDRQQAIRHFRVSRMRGLTRTDETFRMPDDFRLSDYRAADDRTLRAVVRADASAAERVKEQRSYYLERMEPDGADRLLHFRVRHFRELLPLLLGLGASAEVLEPEELRTLVRDELQNMLKRY